MISVDLTAFIGVLLDIILILAFILHSLNNKWFLSAEKKLNLIKRKCEICGSFSFLNSKKGYWRCPNCKSINKDIE